MQGRVNRVIYSVILTAFLLATFSAAAIIITPSPGEHFTEFYLLGPEGLAEYYPRQGTAGEPLSVTTGVTNREGEAHTYRIEARDTSGLIGGIAPFRLQDGETIEQELSFTPRETGEDVKVEFNLYLDNDQEPYRSLRLWLEVLP